MDLFVSQVRDAARQQAAAKAQSKGKGRGRGRGKQEKKRDPVTESVDEQQPSKRVKGDSGSMEPSAESAKPAVEPSAEHDVGTLEPAPEGKETKAPKARASKPQPAREEISAAWAEKDTTVSTKLVATVESLD